MWENKDMLGILHLLISNFPRKRIFLQCLWGLLVSFDIVKKFSIEQELWFTWVWFDNSPLSGIGWVLTEQRGGRRCGEGRKGVWALVGQDDWEQQVGGWQAKDLPHSSYLHFGAFPFDFNYLLWEPIDFKGDEFSIIDAFSRVKGNWNLQCLAWLYHINTEVHLEAVGIGVQTIYAGENQKEGVLALRSLTQRAWFRPPLCAGSR